MFSINGHQKETLLCQFILFYVKLLTNNEKNTVTK